MSQRPDNVMKLSETLTLCEYTSPKSGSFGFWLYSVPQLRGLEGRTG